MLGQGLAANPDLLPCLYEQASANGEVVLTSPQKAKDLLGVCLGNLEKVYIIVDGVDECSRVEQEPIISWFKLFVEAQTLSASLWRRCLFVSQNDSVTRRHLAKLPTLSIGIKDNLGDISSFSVDWSRRIQEKFELLEDRREDIAKKVIQRASDTSEPSTCLPGR